MTECEFDERRRVVDDPRLGCDGVERATRGSLAKAERDQCLKRVAHHFGNLWQDKATVRRTIRVTEREALRD